MAVIDRALSAAANRELNKIDPQVLDVLRVGAFEVLFGRAPAPVAVATTVEVAREVSGRSTGFVNAVLRQVLRQGPAGPDLALPRWVEDLLVSAWGREETEAFAVASLQDAPIVVRQRGASPPRGGRPVEGFEEAFEVEADAVGPLPVQDPSSIAVGQVVRASPGQLVADLAAAPGGKTLHLLDQIEGKGVVVAVELHRRRAQTARTRVPGACWVRGDGRRPPLRKGAFDRVLVDAPCTGLGTLRRRPEIRHRVTAADVERLAITQRQMVVAGLDLLRPGGKLVYSVCTVIPAETVEVVADFDASAPTGLPGRAWGKGWLLGPHLTTSDGMFISVIAA
jgi:16S rRNA (cytosine967-C5)-methyltransferase